MELLENKFYSIDKVVFNLTNRFHRNNSIVGLPKEYTNRIIDLIIYLNLWKFGIGWESLIIKNMFKGNENRALPTNEINDVVQILERIGKTKREGINPERLD